MLQLANISMEFPGVKALDAVHLQFESGKVNALLGENGAGKSTLLNIISGVYQDYTGEMFLNEKLVRFPTVKAAQEAGIAVIHQELSLVPNLTIWENIFLGKELLTKWGLLDMNLMYNKAISILKEVGLDCDVHQIVNELKISQQQLVEIAKAVHSDASVILMDEPTSALDEAEVANLHRLINKWRLAGKTIVYITHKMDELFAIADRYAVLRDGQSVHAGYMKDVNMDTLVQHMVGRSVSINRKVNSFAADQESMAVDSLTLFDESNSNKKILESISFTLNKGEIVGIYGLMGAGRTELLETLFGLHSNNANSNVRLQSQSVAIQSPQDAIAHQMAFITEDRKKDGLVLSQSMLFNYSLPQLHTNSLLNDSKFSNEFEAYRNQLHIKSLSVHQHCDTLSGGNQQKVILAKWLGTKPAILLMDEPTRGIDISAKEEMYALMIQMAKEGMTILFASSEIPEIISLSDRVLVMSNGTITKELIGDSINEKDLLYAALPNAKA